MPARGTQPRPENSFVVECKKCGMRTRVFSAYYQTMKMRCRNCRGLRFRRVPKKSIDEVLDDIFGDGEE